MARLRFSFLNSVKSQLFITQPSRLNSRTPVMRPFSFFSGSMSPP
jgi:hypothetical protein